MTFDPKDFYVLAQWLVDNKQDESSLRTAISRVYYAAHHIAVRKMIEKCSWTPKGSGDDHDGVIRELRGRRFRTQGDRLKSLLEMRQHADYHLDASETNGNRYCLLCKTLRNSKNPADAGVVTDAHWIKVAELADSCIPLLEKI